ncbi:MAG: NAD(P)/FAD-dependent oxidoreductase [Alcanivorax sp.]|nr:NAD(P)/FAD-dependent oxidoreductase [Alcanivorax sp.]
MTAARPCSLQQQLEHCRHSRLRILIAGAGMAGLTLAALLHRQGLYPVVIEQQADLQQGGYMLGLLPLGGNVLHGLDLHRDYLASSQSMRHYQFCDQYGRCRQRYPLHRLTEQYGAYQGITRGRLAQLLASRLPAGAIAFDTRINNLENGESRAHVHFSDGLQADFDLVVAADGLHSSIRKLILRPDEYRYHDTGWGGWVSWVEPASQAADTYTEAFGPGFMAGLYPVSNGLGGFLAGPRKRLERQGRATFLAQLGSLSQTPAFAALLRACREDSAPFFWSLHDCRCRHWYRGRVALLGDAAMGFLPTAGVGASMAMAAAATLNDELTRCDRHTLPQALRHYQHRQEPASRAAQNNSRQLARLMTIESRALSWLRNQLIRFYSLDRALHDIGQVMETRA